MSTVCKYVKWTYNTQCVNMWNGRITICLHRTRIWNSLSKFHCGQLNGIIFLVTGPLCGELTGHRWIPLTKASDAEIWCFLWSAPNKRLSNQSWGWWFETPSSPLWRHRNANQLHIPSPMELADMVVRNSLPWSILMHRDRAPHISVCKLWTYLFR